MQTTFPLRREHAFLFAAVLAVGALAGLAGLKVSLLVVALGALVVAVFLSPTQLFLIWLFITPITETWIISLGENVPDISVDRILFLLLAARLSVKAISSRFRGFKLELEDVLIVLFLACALISILLWRSVDLTGQFLALFQQFIYPVGFYWIVQQVAGREADLKKIFRIASVLLFVLCVPAVVEEFTGVTLLGERSQVYEGVTRVRSFLHASWEFGAIAAMLLMYNLHALTYPGGQRARMVSWLGAALGILGVVFCFMRGAWVAAVVALSFFFFMDKNLRQYLYLGMPFMAVAGLLWVPSLITSAVWTGRVQDVVTILARVEISSQQISSFLQEPILGNGLMPTFATYNLGIISHNTMLSMLVDFGLFSLLYFGAIGIILFRGISAYKTFPPRSFLGRGLLVSLGSVALAFLVNALTFENRIFPFVSALFWVALGLIKAAIRINEERRAKALPMAPAANGGNV
jgi:hypothetical protein